MFHHLTPPNRLLAALFCVHFALPVLAEESPPETSATPLASITQNATSENRGSRRNRTPSKNETEIKELLALIPDHHPMRHDLRQLVYVDPPAGFTARQWLELSMKVNFRTAVSKGGASESDLPE